MAHLENTVSEALRLAPIIAGRLTFFDLDGVLIDATHRQAVKEDGSLDLEHYRANSTRANVMRDKPLPFTTLAKMQGANIVLLTARPACAATLAWLKKHGIKYSAIYAREGNEDTRKDYILKRDHLLDNFTAEQLSGAILLDDNTANCAMFRELGGIALQVAFNGH